MDNLNLRRGDETRSLCGAALDSFVEDFRPPDGGVVGRGRDGHTRGSRPRVQAEDRTPAEGAPRPMVTVERFGPSTTGAREAYVG